MNELTGLTELTEPETEAVAGGQTNSLSVTNTGTTTSGLVFTYQGGTIGPSGTTYFVGQGGTFTSSS